MLLPTCALTSPTLLHRCAACCRDYDVETALCLAYCTIPATRLLSYLSIGALDEWTQSDITKDDLLAYAKRYLDNHYGRKENGRGRRGVIVEKVDHYQDMATHYLFQLFTPGGEEPPSGAAFLSRFLKLKRSVSNLWSTDQYDLSSELLHRPRLEHSNPPDYAPSLAHEFPKVASGDGGFVAFPEAASPERPDRLSRQLAIATVGLVLSLGDESLLDIPKTRRASSSSSLSPSSAAARPSLPSPPPTGGPPSSRSRSSSSSTGMGISSLGVDAAAAVAAFLEFFKKAGKEQQQEATTALRDGLGTDGRYMFRRAFEVNAPSELTPDAVSKVVKEEMRKLSVAKKEQASLMKRPDTKGAAAFVTGGATLAPVDYNDDLEVKRQHAPTVMTVIEGATKSTHWQYDLEHQKAWLSEVQRGIEGNQLVPRDGKVLRKVGNEEKEVMFNNHGRKHSLSWVEREVAERGGAFMAKVCFTSDMLVASWNHGQEIITPVILRLSVAATQWLSRHSFDLFSSLGALLPHSTAVAAADEMARLYDGAFVADTLRLVRATSSSVGQPKAASSQCDNYVAGSSVARHVKLKGNYREVASETRMFGFVKENPLQPGDGGYGKDRFSCEMIRQMFLEVKAELGLACAGGDGKIWSLKLDSLKEHGFAWAELFAMPDLPVDDHKKYRLRDHTLAPQVEACSADRQHFRVHLVEWARDLFGGDWDDVHLFFVFDTEYIPHYISWVERSEEMREVMKNTAVLPCKFHVRKHASETLLSRKPVLRNVLTELLTQVLVTSKEKWTIIKREADADAEAAPAAEAASPAALEELFAVIQEAGEEEATVQDDAAAAVSAGAAGARKLWLVRRRGGRHGSNSSRDSSSHQSGGRGGRCCCSSSGFSRRRQS